MLRLRALCALSLYNSFNDIFPRRRSTASVLIPRRLRSGYFT